MKKGDIVVAMTMAGEIVGKYVKDSESGVTLEDPRTLVQNEEGMGFAKGLCMSGKLDPKVATISNFIFIIECNEDFARAWRQATSGLIL